MNKSAIKAFSIWARNKLIADISYKAGLLELYTTSSQITLFGEPEVEKIPDGLKRFIIKRSGETFQNVAQNPAILKNTNNSPLFLLCFAVSNPNPAAWGLAIKGANHILKHTED